MNIKQKYYICCLIDRMYGSWQGYVSTPPSDLTDCPAEFRDALRLADVEIYDEKNISELEGACRCIGLIAIFDKKKKEIRVETKKGKVIFFCNQQEQNFNIEDVTNELIKKGYLEY